MPERFEIYIVYKRRYINTLPFLFYVHVAKQAVCWALRWLCRRSWCSWSRSCELLVTHSLTAWMTCMSRQMMASIHWISLMKITSLAMSSTFIRSLLQSQCQQRYTFDKYFLKLQFIRNDNNDKNQKVDITRHHIAWRLMWCWVISPRYDFYNIYIFVFIFLVLLLYLSTVSLYSYRKIKRLLKFGWFDISNDYFLIFSICMCRNGGYFIDSNLVVLHGQKWQYISTSGKKSSITIVFSSCT